MRKKITRAAVAGAAATTMLLGAAGAAVAQPPLPGPLGEIADRAVSALEAGQRTEIGHLSSFATHDAKLYKQIMGSQNVIAGEKITVRVEVESTHSQTRVHGLTDVMPAGFKLDSVTYNAPDGTSAPMPENWYYTDEREGVQDTRVDFQGLGDGRVHIGKGKLSVDFTYIAPEENGWKQTGAGMEVSGGGGVGYDQMKKDEGGPSVNVLPRPIIDIPGLPDGDNNSSGSIDWGSLNSGSSN